MQDFGESLRADTFAQCKQHQPFAPRRKAGTQLIRRDGNRIHPQPVLAQLHEGGRCFRRAGGPAHRQIEWQLALPREGRG